MKTLKLTERQIQTIEAALTHMGKDALKLRDNAVYAEVCLTLNVMRLQTEGE